MNQKLNISIKKPCSENFNQFLPTKNGGFCNSCKKEVTDFSKMSDEEVMNYFKNSTHKTCGYFREDQLKDYSNTNDSINKYKFSVLKTSLMGLSLLSFLSFNKSIAKESNTASVYKVQDKDFKKEISVPIKTLQDTVRGTVSDDLGALPGASVVLKNSNIGVTTDFDGKFEFSQPLDKDAILLVSFTGYKTVEFKVSEINDIVLNIKMESYECMMIGEVTVDKVYSSKRTFFQRLKRLFKND